MGCSIGHIAWRRIPLFRWQSFIAATAVVFMSLSTMELDCTSGFACSRKPMRATRRFEGRLSGEQGSYFLAQLLRRMNSAPPSAVRTPSQELFFDLVLASVPRDVVLFLKRVFSCVLVRFFHSRSWRICRGRNHPHSIIFGTCLMNLNAAFARALSGSTGLIIASLLYTRRQAGSSIIWRTAFIFVPLGP
jgi:hypothetical protein